MRAITRPNREAFVFSCLDMRDARPQDAQVIALHNDVEQSPAL